jgi:hypothetical protein
VVTRLGEPVAYIVPRAFAESHLPDLVGHAEPDAQL